MRCNGEPECEDFSDERGCSARGGKTKIFFSFCNSYGYVSSLLSFQISVKR